MQLEKHVICSMYAVDAATSRVWPILGPSHRLIHAGPWTLCRPSCRACSCRVPGVCLNVRYLMQYNALQYLRDIASEGEAIDLR